MDVGRSRGGEGGYVMRDVCRRRWDEDALGTGPTGWDAGCWLLAGLLAGCWLAARWLLAGWLALALDGWVQARAAGGWRWCLGLGRRHGGGQR